MEEADGIPVKYQQHTLTVSAEGVWHMHLGISKSSGSQLGLTERRNNVLCTFMF